MRRDGECVGERVTRMDLEGRRRKGRPTRADVDGQCKWELEGEGLLRGEMQNRFVWR